MDIVVHLTKITPTTTLASARIAKFLAKTLNLEIYDTAEKIVELAPTIARVVYLVNGPPAFCSFREELAQVILHCKTVVFVQNDYTIYPPSQVNKVMRNRGWVNDKGHVTPPYRWGTIPKKGGDYINWNALTFKNLKQPAMHDGCRDKGLFYYGAYREGRNDSFLRFFSDLRTQLTISASVRAGRKFHVNFPHAHIINPVKDIIDKCGGYRYGLYMHDNYSTKNYCSPANRFYEMLSAGMLIFVDAEAEPTLAEAGFTVPREFIVNTGMELKRRISQLRDLENYIAARDWQQKMWFSKAKGQRAKLPSEIKRLRRKVK